MDELTKQIAQAERNKIKAKIVCNEREIEGLEQVCQVRVEENKTLKAQLKALEKDIPEPKVEG